MLPKINASELGKRQGREKLRRVKYFLYYMGLRKKVLLGIKYYKRVIWRYCLSYIFVILTTIYLTIFEIKLIFKLIVSNIQENQTTLLQ